MPDWETTKIKGDVKDRAKGLDPTFTEIMHMGCIAYEAELLDVVDGSIQSISDEYGVSSKTDVEEVAELLLDALDTGDGDSVDAEAVAAQVVRHFDYAEVAKQTADEIEGRMR